MTTEIVTLTIGFVLGIFAGAWGLPKRVINKTTQSIRKIKGNNAPVQVEMVPKKKLRKGFGWWFKKRK